MSRQPSVSARLWSRLVDMANATVSLDEYLRTSYEWEPEWADGKLVEREMSDVSHSDAQTS